ncbi:MAG: DUF6580 family putative transport protein [Chitinophagales bacterium]
MKRNNINILLAIFLILIAATARIVNAGLHIPNIVPIAAISLFSGAIIKDKRGLAFLVPLLGQFLADVYFQLFTAVPGFYDLAGQLFTYGALICATALGTTMKEPKPLTSLAYVFGASTTFFLISNFGYFAHGWNGYSFAGLTKTYIDGIPFFKYTLAGDMAGGVILFGGYFLVQHLLIKKAQKVKA